MTAVLMHVTDETDWLEKRKGYITSTESSSLFGLQMPSLPTAYEQWHIKRGMIDNNIEANQRMVWGKRLEQTIAMGIAEDNDFELVPMRAFAYDDADKIGASFDHFIRLPDGELALLEIKTVAYRDYKEKFIEDDEKDAEGNPVFIEAPAYYEVQVQQELELINNSEDYKDKVGRCLLAVFVMDTRDVKLLWRDRDRDMGAAIRAKVRGFWASEEPPAPDLIADAELLAKMHRAKNTDKAYDATQDNDFEIAALSYLQESEKAKAADEAKKKARSQMILAMGDCNTAWCNSARVSNKTKWTVTQIGRKQ